eukprot:Seg16459.1 transcript_id=Seg16459.1/GoldUCD/mRNA.D3Y31 product="hypothetical protein" protein_id=Seg16459.1/GoldUCD/D3Y31
MTKFRPCIDLHDGKVKQIVGGSLTDSGEGLKENFTSNKAPSEFAKLYREHHLTGGHIIQLGAGNQEAAQDALGAWKGGMQVGGGINIENASTWIETGASHVIVTSWLFDSDGTFREDRLKTLSSELGKEKIIVDLSCRRTSEGWTVAMNRWQTLTNLHITKDTLDLLASYCDEYLIHAADVEGLCGGVDLELVEYLGAWAGIPMTYAGGVATMKDLELAERHSDGNVDITVGSALDIFGGSGVTFQELIDWNNR